MNFLLALGAGLSIGMVFAVIMFFTMNIYGSDKNERKN